MKKLRLDLDQLAVETFKTKERGGARRGTVHGAEQEYSCGGTCDYSCEETCTCPWTYEYWRVDSYATCVVACPVC